MDIGTQTVVMCQVQRWRLGRDTSSMIAGNGSAMSEIAKYGVFVFPYGTSEYQLLHTSTSSTDIHHVFHVFMLLFGTILSHSHLVRCSHHRPVGIDIDTAPLRETLNPPTLQRHRCAVFIQADPLADHLGNLERIQTNEIE